MSRDDFPVSPGLHIVSTPIGRARDITLHAIDVLRGADVLAAEDTRAARRLLGIHGISLSGRRMVSYHDHSGERRRPALLEALRGGASVACMSDAGTPLIADPGYGLVRECVELGLPVHVAPGASSVMAALALSGLPTDRFYFAGFLPPRAAARRRALAELSVVPGSIVFFESPRRALSSLGDMRDVLGPSRPAALCREMTKRFEQVIRSSLGELCASLREVEIRGEIVVVVGAGERAPASDAEALDALRESLGSGSLKDAVARVSSDLGLPRRRVYKLALELDGRGPEGGAGPAPLS